MKISGIYKIVNNKNDKYYVGSSCNIVEKRWSEHKSNLNHNIHDNDYLQKSWNKHGQESFSFNIIEEVPKDKLLEVEQKYLDEAKKERNKSYNLTFIAHGGMAGLSDYSRKKHRQNVIQSMANPDVRRKISEAKKGKSLACSHRHNISKSLKGISRLPLTEEHKRKIGEKSKGRIPSEETRLKMSLMKIGKVCLEGTKKKIQQSNSKIVWGFLSPDGEVYEFKNLRGFCREKGLEQSAMWRVYNKRLNHYKGWKNVQSISR
jgi:group I intron endonuclease